MAHIEKSFGHIGGWSYFDGKSIVAGAALAGAIISGIGFVLSWIAADALFDVLFPFE